jgi:hypothetical protein
MEAAKRRLMENADPAVKQLTEIAYDETKSDDIRLKATLALIDRAGLSPRQVLDVEVTAKPYEILFESVELGGSRADYRRSIGQEPEAEAEAEDVWDRSEANGVDLARWQDGLIVEAEIDYLVPSDDVRPSPFDPPATPGTALVPYDEAVHQAAVLRQAHRR